MKNKNLVLMTIAVVVMSCNELIVDQSVTPPPIWSTKF